MNIFREAGLFTRQLWRQRWTIYELARRDFAGKHQRAYLGLFWSYLEPLTYIGLLVFVFAVGLRANPAGDVPFMVYLVSGMIAWQFFSQTLGALTPIIRQYSFLVKQSEISLAFVHVAKLLSELIPHLVLIAASMAIAWWKGIPPGWHTLQIVYYLTAMCLLLLGLGWISSSTSLFVDDAGKAVRIIILFGFWLTPIIWNLQMVPVRYRWVFKLNPAYYLVSGYRDSLIYGTPFWEKPAETLYFWMFTGIILLAGVTVFRRLKPHFGEVV